MSDHFEYRGDSKYWRDLIEFLKDETQPEFAVTDAVRKLFVQMIRHGKHITIQTRRISNEEAKQMLEAQAIADAEAEAKERQYDADNRAMHDGLTTVMHGREGYSVLTVDGRKAKCGPGALGCCLMNLYYRLRDNPNEPKNGERIMCGKRCQEGWQNRHLLFEGNMWHPIHRPEDKSLLKVIK